MKGPRETPRLNRLRLSPLAYIDIKAEKSAFVKHYGRCRRRLLDSLRLAFFQAQLHWLEGGNIMADEIAKIAFTPLLVLVLVEGVVIITCFVVIRLMAPHNYINRM